MATMCSNLLCLPEPVVELIYFYILLIANTLNCLIAIASIYLVIRRRCCPRSKCPLPDVAPAISVVIPCYLPNEEDIIESTIRHFMRRLEWPGPLTLHVVYNTPSDRAIEERLRAMDGHQYTPDRKLRIVRVEGSTSKAENLNHILPTLTDGYVALYDADHHPNADSLRRLHRQLISSGCVATQGSTYIRNTPGSLLARAVDAEFLITHFIYFPAMEVLGGTAYFGGSNALWRTDILTQYPFDATMLTEDVDVSARALLDGHRIAFCPKARSGELSPAGARALVNQRLRWFMGWEQVTHKYYWRVFPAKLSPWRKTGFCYLFHLRWLLLFAAVLAAVINPVLTSPFIYPLFTWSMPIQVCVYAAVALYAFLAVLSTHAAFLHEQRRPMAILAVIVFFLIGWLYAPALSLLHLTTQPWINSLATMHVTRRYVVLHFTLQSVAFCKVFLRREGEWHVTARLTAGVAPSPPSVGDLAALAQPLLSHAEQAMSTAAQPSVLEDGLHIRSAPRRHGT